MEPFPTGPFRLGNKSGPVMRCPHCRQWTPSKGDFCIHCGLPLEVPEREEEFCPNCGEDLPREARFCPHCGMALLGPGLHPALRALLLALSILPPFGVWAVGVLGRSPSPADRRAIGWVFLLSLAGTAFLALLFSLL